MRAQVILGHVPEIEENQPLARSKPFHDRHGFLQRHQGCRISPCLAGDGRIGKRHQQAVANGARISWSIGGRLVCQSPEIVMEEVTLRPRRMCRTKTDRITACRRTRKSARASVHSGVGMDYVYDVDLVVAEYPSQRLTACGEVAEGIFQGPGQKQMGAAGHAPSPSIPTPPFAVGRAEHEPRLLSRPTFPALALSMRGLFQKGWRCSPR